MVDKTISSEKNAKELSMKMALDRQDEVEVVKEVHLGDKIMFGTHKDRREKLRDARRHIWGERVVEQCVQDTNREDWGAISRFVTWRDNGAI